MLYPIIGAAIGGYTQHKDGENNYFQTIAGMGIGGVAGAAFRPEPFHISAVRDTIAKAPIASVVGETISQMRLREASDDFYSSMRRAKREYNRNNKAILSIQNRILNAVDNPPGPVIYKQNAEYNSYKTLLYGIQNREKEIQAREQLSDAQIIMEAPEFYQSKIDKLSIRIENGVGDINEALNNKKKYIRIKNRIDNGGTYTADELNDVRYGLRHLGLANARREAARYEKRLTVDTSRSTSWTAEDKIAAYNKSLAIEMEKKRVIRERILNNIHTMTGDTRFEYLKDNDNFLDEINTWVKSNNNDFALHDDIKRIKAGLSYSDLIENISNLGNKVQAKTELTAINIKDTDAAIKQIEKELIANLHPDKAAAMDSRLIVHGLSELDKEGYTSSIYRSETNSGIRLHNSNTGHIVNFGFSTNENGVYRSVIGAGGGYIDESGNVVESGTKVVRSRVAPFAQAAFAAGGDPDGIIKHYGITRDMLGIAADADKRAFGQASFDALSMLAFFRSAPAGDAVDKQAIIENQLNYMKQMISSTGQYMPNDAYTSGPNYVPTKRAKNFSGSMYVGHQLVPNKTGGAIANQEVVFSKLSSYKTDGNIQSTYHQILHSMNTHEGRDVLAGISGNNFTHFMSKERAAEVELEEGIGGHGYYNTTRAMKASSEERQITTLMLSDEAADMMPHIFGDQYAFADGFGLFDEAASDVFSRTDATEVFLPFRKANGSDKTISTPFDALAKVLRKEDGLSSIGEFSADTIIGLNEDGSPIKLGRHFTHGEIVSMTETNKGIRLIVNATNDASKREQAKIFSSFLKGNAGRVDSATFGAMKQLVALTNAGAIKHTAGKFMLHGAEISAEDLGAHLMQLSSTNTFESSAIHMVRASDSGMDSIVDILNGKSGAVDSFVKKFNHIDELKPAIARMQDSATSNIDKASIGRMIMSLSDYKAGTALGAEVKMPGFEFMDHHDPVKLNALMEEFIRNGASGTHSVSSKITVDLGTALAGAGNTGSMSWLESRHLTLSGIPLETLDKIAPHDPISVHDFNLIKSMGDMGQIGISDLDSHLKKIAITDVFGKPGELRSKFLEDNGISVANASDNMLSYTLSEGALDHTLDGKATQIKSIPISLITSNRSGTYNLHNKEVLAKLDQARREVIEADIQYKNIPHTAAEHVAAAKQMLHSKMTNLWRVTQEATSGDNSIQKNLMRRSPIDSLISTARPAGGEISRHAAETSIAPKNGIRYSQNSYFSEESIRNMIGGDAEYRLEDVDGFKDIKRVMVKNADGNWTQHQHLLNREPTHSPYSTMAMDSYVSTRLRGASEIYVPQLKDAAGKRTQQLFELFTHLDYDNDQMRAISLHNLTNEEQELFRKRTAGLMSKLDELAPFFEDLTIKGRDKTPTTVFDFKSIAEYTKDRAIGREKAAIRKTQAAPAVELAVRMQSAVHKYLGPIGIGEIPSTRHLVADAMAMEIAENLIKSSHKKNQQFASEVTPDFHKFNEALEKKDAKAIKEIFERSFNTESINANAKKRKLLDEGMEDIINAMQAHGDKVFYPSMQRPQSTADVITWAEKAGDAKLAPTAGSKNTVLKKTASFVEEAKSGIIKNFKKNKTLFAMAAGGLAGLSLINQTAPSNGIEAKASAQPQAKQQSIAPIATRNEYIRKNKPDSGYNTQARVRMSDKNLNPKTINQTIYGNKLGSANVRIQKSQG